jgi:hypothetical protein
MSVKKVAMYERIREHGDDLNRIFNTGIEAVALCKKLRRLEVKGNKAALNYGNGSINIGQFEKEEAKTLKLLGKMLWYNKIPDVPVFFNSDPRGYALKIDNQYVRDNKIKIYRDWGGYGIIAPDLTNE